MEQTSGNRELTQFQTNSNVLTTFFIMFYVALIL
jgi:hypothetical protein